MYLPPCPCPGHEKCLAITAKHLLYKFSILMKFPFSSRFRLLLPLNTRFFVMFVFPRFGQYASFLAGPFEAPEGTVQCFILANFYFRHYTFPPSAKTIEPQSLSMRSNILLCIKILYHYTAAPVSSQQVFFKDNY
ncbi:MAG: hypothetical protein A4E55_02124 [Pelotomaculum sp. PtaU1.Bin035]|nr:MAG: hypothetical protein A4E55_02124 [Pelotomaculum sp. PtaU1.Bin035]